MKELWNFYSRKETDRQYNPTLWTRRLPTADLLPSHIDFTTRRSNEYRKKMGEQLKTISFGKDQHAGNIDVFRTQNVSEDAPMVVYIHGGWWQWFSNDQFSFLAEPFNKKGMAVYMPAYRLAQDWDNGKPMESIVKQMEYAVATILKEACDKGSQAVYLVGHSAGGHLVSMLHKTDWSQYNLPKEAQKKVKAVFSLAGLFDLRFLLDSFVNDEIKMSLESAEAVSPQLLGGSKKTLCPIHLILPEFDTAEFFRQTKEYQDKLLEEGQKCHLHVVHNRDHLTIIENMINDHDELLDYIFKQMTKSH
ncbi:alpha/beta hydrolase [Xanthovirga aplysinae]|uniref:alpha/beta hydrolase n=1 Tax=Xanthovirga aplysinae TaxID=2529853 RepID=UPI0012BC299C|nr:alpha/beta hydrolase [Xanthovirga aplysinae]MTI30425.1 alpha/beta hydrolase [Xanthovirga aplysinae]